MWTMLNRTILVLMMEKANIDLKYIKKYSNEQLLRCCENLQHKGIPCHWYGKHKNILCEMIENETFFDYLVKFDEAELDGPTIDYLIKTIRSHNGMVTDYPVDRIIKTLKIQSLNKETYYDYLEYFSHLSLSCGQRDQIVENLAVFYTQKKYLFSDLTEMERSVFKEPFVSESKLIPVSSIKVVCEMLSNEAALLDLVRFWFEKEVRVSLDLSAYKAIRQESNRVKAAFIDAFRLFDENAETVTCFATRWIENNCLIYDLEILERRLRPLSMEERQTAVESRASYINLLYGNKISNIPLADIRSYQEDILIYAITNKKNRFIKLVEDNQELFVNMSRWSILFDRSFYARYVNLNTLTAKNLKDIARMTDQNWSINVLERDYYTFAEIKALYGLSLQYIQLYDILTIPGVDDRLTTLKQLTKRDLLKSIGENDICKLAEMLSRKQLYAWIREDFAHIQELKAPEAIQILISYNEILDMIPQMETSTDVLLTVRVKDSIRKYEDIKSLKSDLTNIDPAWADLVREMDFDNEFLQENEENIIHFICRNGAQIALTYYQHLTNGKRESFKRIVKAELMGRFNSLKYYEDDLRREISYPVNDTMKSAWAQNLDILKGGILVKECDDFFSTMLLGTMPQRTCLSYIDGEYKECLLASFDTNKKLLYAYMNGRVIGRAIIRLTKGRYKNPDEHRDDGNEASLFFVDVEDIDATSVDKKKDSLSQEYLTLFLERPYIAGVSPEIESQVHNLFIEIMETKASLMGCTLVLSSNYGSVKRPGYVHTSFNLYISQSKAGAQYLDSLSGSAHVADERSYRSNHFMIRQNDICA